MAAGSRFIHSVRKSFSGDFTAFFRIAPDKKRKCAVKRKMMQVQIKMLVQMLIRM